MKGQNQHKRNKEGLEEMFPFHHSLLPGLCCPAQWFYPFQQTLRDPHILSPLRPGCVFSLLFSTSFFRTPKLHAAFLPQTAPFPCLLHPAARWYLAHKAQQLSKEGGPGLSIWHIHSCPKGPRCAKENKHTVFQIHGATKKKTFLSHSRARDLCQEGG